MRNLRFVPVAATTAALLLALAATACDSSDPSPSDTASDPATEVADVPVADEGVGTEDTTSPDLPADDTAGEASPEDAAEVGELPGDDATDVPVEVHVPACVGTPGQPAWPKDSDATFLRGPYVQDVRDDHAFIVFRPATPMADPGCVTWEVEGVAAAVAPKACVDADAYGQYAVRIDGLPPDTAVTYSVSVGTTMAAGPLTFRSAPPLDRPQRLMVVADIHSNPDRTANVLSKIVDRALAAGVDYAVTVGDHVDQPEETQFNDLFAGLRAMLHRVPVFATIGNHEARSPNYFEAFVLPEADPPDALSGELYYSMRRGNTWIGVLELIDWQVAWYAGGEPFGQVEWLARELDSEAARSARWRLLFIHEPPWCVGWGHCDEPQYHGEEALRDLLVPMARDKGVSVIFSGHMHGYERGAMEGVQLVVAGGGGGGLDHACSIPEGLPDPWESDYVHHSLVVETGCDALTLVATDIDGNEIDGFTLPYAGL